MDQEVDTRHPYTNRLIRESSPYLLSHAHNPVDWYPWGDEAIARARELDRPIFLSIGYAACHWCHVMERESFENEEIAAILNERYVAIKVDREQRPDIDHIYMTFTQAMTGHGGWPMSVFLTPDLKPFFAGTYFPRESFVGRPGFKYILTEIAEAYRANRDEIATSSRGIYEEILKLVNAPSGGKELSETLIAQTITYLGRTFDHAHGGFGSAPKFPHPLDLSLFMRWGRKTGDLTFLLNAEKTLQNMARGGIYDQLGGGFARYATDDRWLIPHFEKMLYDNALLVPVYGQAYQITGNEFYLDIVRGVLDFLLRELAAPEGGFHSALDADSEGEEGRFYVWTADEIRQILGDDADLFMRYYNVTDGGNFEGKSILHLTEESDRLRESYEPLAFDRMLGRWREKMMAARERRVRPLVDDKILTSWNGLAISALCAGFQLTNDRSYLHAAIAAAEFLLRDLYRDNHLTHAWRAGVHSTGEFLEDYAYLIRGLLDLYESDVTGPNERWLVHALELTERTGQFLDTDHTFYLRPSGEADLIFRPKEEIDSALPAPGSVMIHNYLWLHRLTDRRDFAERGEKTLAALSGQMSTLRGHMTSALLALDYYLSPKIDVVIVGGGRARDEMLREVYRRYLPNRVLAFGSDASNVSSLFLGRTGGADEVRAYVCRDSVCGLPATTPDALRERLSQSA